MPRIRKIPDFGRGRERVIVVLCIGATIFMTTEIISTFSQRDPFLDLLQQSLPGSDTRVLKVLRQQYLTPPSTLAYNLSTDSVYLNYSTSLSWDYVNHYLRQFFVNQRDGFFVEAGALDGEFLSNSIWLEQTLGWNGLLIEPDTNSYLQLLDKRRHCWSSHTCISSNIYPKETVFVSRKLREGYTGIKWYHRGSSNEYGVTLDPSYEELLLLTEETMYTIRCFPLASYLKALNVTTVDMLSLDIQGSELDVLKTIPWNNILIKIIVVEVANADRVLHEYLEKVGYFWIEHPKYVWYEDNIFVRKDILSWRREPIQPYTRPH